MKINHHPALSFTSVNYQPRSSIKHHCQTLTTYDKQTHHQPSFAVEIMQPVLTIIQQILSIILLLIIIINHDHTLIIFSNHCICHWVETHPPVIVAVVSPRSDRVHYHGSKRLPEKDSPKTAVTHLEMKWRYVQPKTALKHLTQLKVRLGDVVPLNPTLPLRYLHLPRSCFPQPSLLRWMPLAASMFTT